MNTTYGQSVIIGSNPQIPNVPDNKIYFAKINPDATIPCKREEDAGFDLYACFEEKELRIPPFSTVQVPTGLISAFSKHFFGEIDERGSTGAIGMKVSSGIMDSGYRGEWKIMLYNANPYPIIITKEADDVEAIKYSENGVAKTSYINWPYRKAIAQCTMRVVPCVGAEEMPLEYVKSIPSLRGEGRTGSSGK